MRRLQATGLDSIEVHRRIIDSKQEPRRSRLRHASVAVEARISRLIDEGPIDLAEADRDAATCSKPNKCSCLACDLDHCWESITDALRAAKAVLEAEMSFHSCPYCGMSEARTFDHYLPREFYPEFSATVANLVPSCGTCNVLKGTHIATGRQRILNPIFDPVDEPLFCCVISEADGLPIPQLALNRLSFTTMRMSDVCEFHIARLNLRQRFRDLAVPFVAAFLVSLEDRRVPIGPKAARLAKDAAYSVGFSSTPNNWQAMLFAAVAEWIDHR